MKAAAALAAALLVNCSCAGRLPQPDIAPKDLEVLADETAVLASSAPDGSFRLRCGGVWLGPRLLVTASHCVDPDDGPVYVQAYRYLVRHQGEIDEATPAKVQAIDHDHDVALVVVSDDLPHTNAELSERGLGAGDVGHVLGHTGGLLYSYGPAHVGATREVEGPHGKVDAYQVWGPVWNGNSGSGLWDRDGKLAGVCSFRSTGVPLSFYIRVSYVRKLLAQ